MTHSFVVLDRAEAVAVDLARICRTIPRFYASYADQLLRASASVALNISEANGRAGKDRTYHFRVAYASAREVSSIFRILLQIQAVCPDQLPALLKRLDQIRAMTWRLMNPG